MAPAACLLAGCSSGADLVSNVALPAEQATGYVDGADMVASPGPESATLDLTPAQRGYLDALTASGVRPSSELRALSIGSYVCQARAAGQGQQAVWDYVAPMVRSDIADSHVLSPQAGERAHADSVIADYIRLATQRLC